MAVMPARHRCYMDGRKLWVLCLLLECGKPLRAQNHLLRTMD